MYTKGMYVVAFLFVFFLSITPRNFCEHVPTLVRQGKARQGKVEPCKPCGPYLPTEVEAGQVKGSVIPARR